MTHARSFPKQGDLSRASCRVAHRIARRVIVGVPHLTKISQLQNDQVIWLRGMSVPQAILLSHINDGHRGEQDDVVDIFVIK